MISEEQMKQLVSCALGMVPRAYAPYSRFQVGAAVRAASGKTYGGANMENASYPAGVCAERSAIARAVAAGERKLEAIAICGGKDGEVTDYCPPCGICRQTMREFCDPEAFVVVMAKSAADFRVCTLAQLLPESFGPASLGD